MEIVTRDSLFTPKQNFILGKLETGFGFEFEFGSKDNPFIDEYSPDSVIEGIKIYQTFDSVDLCINERFYSIDLENEDTPVINNIFEGVKNCIIKNASKWEALNPIDQLEIERFMELKNN